MFFWRKTAIPDYKRARYLKMAVFVVKVNFFAHIIHRYNYLNIKKCMLDFFENHILVPWDPPGVLLGPILGPNRGMFSKFNGDGPLGSKG